jgi:hypothetical protein
MKVVEGQEIYNLAIHCLDHFYSTFWRFAQSNRAAWKRFAGTGALERAGRADAARRLRRVRAGPARRGRPRYAGPRAVDPAPGTVPPSTPCPLDPRVARAVAAPRRPSRRPPIGVSAVPAHVAAVPCRVAPHTAALGRLDVRTPPLHLTAGI